MILPNKYIEPEQSIFYLGAMILKKLGHNKYSIDDLWILLKKDFYIKMNYARFVQIVVYLYAIGILNYSKEGYIYNENFEN